ncbi:hypothetical protein SAICODRAFT_26761 [Saitoella complicata NRRL Y-17804]|uniref:uncharacterized protein n=1 Tax=Saitoella complicata (strain BCRC 22490 / CBS 7301 / JCM 7358 / NBRC 10748 / NRRL Y-17804) TaxID=698492 RepID=UPI00086824C6|nr:uncharacterized protein SAICODRAFT_26761 [Saitoella complicata NRRL Y-17804]ODQ51323.1 hypothetical protein SAICODRAFT_26761 [Saitoella complicata NRRL Y-17804]
MAAAQDPCSMNVTSRATKSRFPKGLSRAQLHERFLNGTYRLRWRELKCVGYRMDVYHALCGIYGDTPPPGSDEGTPERPANADSDETDLSDTATNDARPMTAGSSVLESPERTSEESLEGTPASSINGIELFSRDVISTKAIGGSPKRSRWNPNRSARAGEDGTMLNGFADPSFFEKVMPLFCKRRATTYEYCGQYRFKHGGETSIFRDLAQAEQDMWIDNILHYRNKLMFHHDPLRTGNLIMPTSETAAEARDKLLDGTYRLRWRKLEFVQYKQDLYEKLCRAKGSASSGADANGTTEERVSPATATEEGRNNASDDDVVFLAEVTGYAVVKDEDSAPYAEAHQQYQSQLQWGHFGNDVMYKGCPIIAQLT